jgi:hypothetical protein
VSRDVLRRLGERVTASWRARDFDERAYADVARTALAGDDGVGAIEVDALLAELAAAPDLPRPSEDVSGLGHVAVTAYRDGHHVIDVHVASDVSFAVVRPCWVGAYRLLRGALVHTTYAIAGRPVHSGFVVGDVMRGAPELVVAGGHGDMPWDERVGHRLVHLAPLGVAIALKTEGAIRNALRFLPPAVAYAPVKRAPQRRAQHELIAALARGGSPLRRTLLERFIDRADAESALLLLCDLALTRTCAPDEVFALLTRDPARFAAFRDRFPAIVSEQDRQRAVTAAFGRATSELDRLLVAALAESPTRAVLAALVAAHAPGVALDDALATARTRLGDAGELIRHWQMADALP